MTLRFCSAFAGIGGFDYGFELAGMTCVSQIEVDKHARSVLAHHWPDVPLLGDIRDVSGTDLGDIDVLVGGFPCQDVSIANTVRKGLDGSRSGLYFEFVRLVDEYARLVDALNPRFVVLENVGGLLGSNRGADMGVVTRTLADLGYVGSWRLVNTLMVDRSYGSVPQQRERVLVVGHRGEHPGAREVLADAEGGGADPRLDHEGRRDGARRSPSGASASPDGAVRLTFRKSRRPRSVHDYATWVDDGRSNTLNTFDVGITRTTHLVVEGDRARILTPREWERLFGYPDDWTAVDGIPDSARYRMLGNSISTNVTHWLGDRLCSIPLLAAA